MSDHEKVYGICENKCMVEVLPKENIFVIKKPNVTINGDNGYDGWWVNLPEGFNASNSVLIATRFGDFAMPEIDGLWGNVVVNVTFVEEEVGISVKATGHNGTSLSGDVVVVIMKIA